MNCLCLEKNLISENLVLQAETLENLYQSRGSQNKLPN